ncbi:MAG: porin family protein [Flavisolibacter sp.]|nr:porin family protein [Flavisolibacter sp.]
MKKVLFATLLMGSVSAAFSQSNINKGDWMLGGDAGFSSQKQGDYKTTSFSLAPNAGYFFINSFAGGLRAQVSSSKSEFGSTESKNSGFSLAPFVRYYFLPATQKVNLFADASFGFGQNKYESGVVDSKSNFTQLGIKAGPAIFLTPATALEIAVGYNSTKIKNVDDRENAFGVNVGFQIHLPGSKK